MQALLNVSVDAADRSQVFNRIALLQLREHARIRVLRYILLRRIYLLK